MNNHQSDDMELIGEFVAEGRDMLDDAEGKLMGLQYGDGAEGGVDSESVNAIFRQFHSIKGSAGFFGFTAISSLTHEAETLLDMLRKQKLVCCREHVDLLCATCDVLRRMFDGIIEQGADDVASAQSASLLNRLQAAMGVATSGGRPIPDVPAPPPAPGGAPDMPAPAEAVLTTPDMVRLFVQDSTELLEDAEQSLLKLEQAPPESADLINEVFRCVHTFKGNCGFLGYNDMQQLSHRLETVLNLVRDRDVPLNESNWQVLLNVVGILQQAVARLGDQGDPAIQGCEVMLQLLDELLPAPAVAAAPAVPDEPLAAPARDDADDRPVAVKRPAPAAARQSVRVDVDKLDLLNNLIGELVIAESMVTNNRDLAGLRLEDFERCAHHLHGITAALQNIAMSLRMVPLAATLRKLTRLVHDLAGKSGKKLDLRLEGEDTEVDKTVAELIADPLVHLVRNSADHGIETPAERLAAGKPETGRIGISARHQSGEVRIDISDDGRGLDRARILARGCERGLVKGNGEGLSDDDVYALVMEPGFSTAETVTDISGRGVGMDVVKRNLEKMRGKVEINTTPGRGTTFTLRIPLTLAIIQGMLLRVGRERYVLPMLSIRESLRPRPEMIYTVTGRGEVIDMRGELLPLFRLNRLLNIPDAEADAAQAIVMVVEDGHRVIGLLVDELLGQHEVVIKSLGEATGRIEGVSGAAIMPDGNVGLILDVNGLVGLATHS